MTCRRYRGLGLPQPFADGDRTADTTLQQLTDELDGGNVVAIDVSDSDTPDEMYASATGRAGCWPTVSSGSESQGSSPNRRTGWARTRR